MANKIGSAMRTYWAKMTPEERSIEMKRRRAVGFKKAKKITHHERNGKAHGEEAIDYSNHVSYLFGKAETLIEHYADNIGVPRAALAHGVGALLQRKHDQKRPPA